MQDEQDKLEKIAIRKEDQRKLRAKRGREAKRREKERIPLEVLFVCILTEDGKMTIFENGRFGFFLLIYLIDE